MKDVNKIILIGRLGANPSLRHTKSGIAVAQLSVATSRRMYKSDFSSAPGGAIQDSPQDFPRLPKSSNKLPVLNDAATHEGHSSHAETSSYSEETQWHRVVVWNRQGEACAQYLKKGDKVYVEGFVRTRSYQDKEGQTKYTFEIHAEDISFLSNRSSNGTSMATCEAGDGTPALNPEFAIPEVGL